MFLRSMLCGLAIAALAPGSEAALQKYRLQLLVNVNSGNVVPNPDNGRYSSEPGIESQDVALIENAGAGPSSTILRRFLHSNDIHGTVHVPSLALDIFVSNNFREGPGSGVFHGGPVPPFTGTGSTASTIRWGVVTGWTVSGWFWCNSNPSLVCNLAMGEDEATVSSRFNSDFYDLGTWTFHGTGFTATPYVNSYNSNDPGNVVYLHKGFAKHDGSVPALPVVGLVLLGGSLVAGAAAALHRRRGQLG